MEKIEISKLVPYARNSRVHDPKQVRAIARSIKAFGFNNPVLIDEENVVIAGHGRLEAAKQLGLKEIPAVRLTHLSEKEKKAYVIADNRLAERASWDEKLLKLELQELSVDVDFDLALTGFETPETDLLLYGASESSQAEVFRESPDVPKRVQPGDVWALGRHKIICADARAPASFQTLLGCEKADVVVTDVPYNVKINGHVCGKGRARHPEFAMASGEMSEAEFRRFLEQSFQNMRDFSKDGSLHFSFIDWGHVGVMLAAGKAVYDELKNICIWAKDAGGMGSLYRSRHEMICVFKHGSSPHCNNIELGRYGRNRTNVWEYPAVRMQSRLSKGAPLLHPTVKPVGLIADILLDASRPGEIVLDPFGGSGSTLLAAERTGRAVRLIELSPHYCDVILRRYEQAGGKGVKLIRRSSNENSQEKTVGKTGNKKLFIRRRVR